MGVLGRKLKQFDEHISVDEEAKEMEHHPSKPSDGFGAISFKISLFCGSGFIETWGGTRIPIILVWGYRGGLTYGLDGGK